MNMHPEIFPQKNIELYTPKKKNITEMRLAAS